MKKWIFIVSFFFLSDLLIAQVSVKAIVPEKPVTIGEPFRIQFVIENALANQRFSAPDFGWLKIVRGPETYAGTQATYFE